MMILAAGKTDTVFVQVPVGILDWKHFSQFAQSIHNNGDTLGTLVDACRHGRLNVSCYAILTLAEAVSHDGQARLPIDDGQLTCRYLRWVCQLAAFKECSTNRKGVVVSACELQRRVGLARLQRTESLHAVGDGEHSLRGSGQL